jgi:hypothetical protein
LPDATIAGVMGSDGLIEATSNVGDWAKEMTAIEALSAAAFSHRTARFMTILIVRHRALAGNRLPEADVSLSGDNAMNREFVPLLRKIRPEMRTAALLPRQGAARDQ